MLNNHWLKVAPLTLCLLLACSDDETRRPGIPATSNNSSSTGVGAAGGSGGSGGTSTVGGGGMGGLPDGEIGSIPVTDIPDTACGSTTATGVEIHPTDAFAPLYSRLERVGNRWVTGHGPGIEGIVFFDDNGANASVNPLTLGVGNRFASEGATVGLAAIDAGNVVFGRFDEQGQAVMGTVTLGTGDTMLAPEVGAGGGEALVVWAESGTLNAAGIASGGNASAAFEIAANAYVNLVNVAVAKRTGGFAVAYTGNDQQDRFTTRFILTTNSAVEGSAVLVTTGSEHHRVVRMVKTPSGYALLIEGPWPDKAPFVLLLDEEGRSSVAYKLVGAKFGWDLAAQGSELGLLAARDVTTEVEFRSFDASMSPLGDWVCVDAGDVGDEGGLAPDGSGYAAIYRRPQMPAPEGKEIFVRFNNLGTAP